MIMFCVVFVSVLSRDFGPMLTAERRSTKLSLQSSEVSDSAEVGAMKPEVKETSEDDAYSGEDACTATPSPLYILIALLCRSSGSSEGSALPMVSLCV